MRIKRAFRASGGCLLLAGLWPAYTSLAQVPDHPIITEVYTDPVGVHDGAYGHDPANPNQGFLEFWLPTCAQLDPALGIDCNNVQLTFYEVEGDASSSGVELINYRFDLPPFDIDLSTPPAPGVIARPASGVVVLGWVEYSNDTGICAGDGSACSVLAQNCTGPTAGVCKDGSACSVALQNCADLTLCEADCQPAPTGLGGTPTTRVALVNGGITSVPAAPDDYVFIAINGHHFGTGTTNFATLGDESLIHCPPPCSRALSPGTTELRDGVIQNGSAVYLLVNRADPGYVQLFDDKDLAFVPPTSNADPALAAGNRLSTSAFLDGLAGNDDRKFRVDRQPPRVCNDTPDRCNDLETILPEGGAFSDLIAQIPEKDTTRITPTVGNGYARVFVDGLKTTEKANACIGGANNGLACNPDLGKCTNSLPCSVNLQNCADGSNCNTDHVGQCGATGVCSGVDLFLDATLRYRLIRNNGPFPPTPGRVVLTTSPPELGVAKAPEQVFEVLTETTGRPGVLSANTGGDTGIDVSVSGGVSSNPSAATFGPGLIAANVPGQTFAFPSVAVSVPAGAAVGASASATVTVTATRSFNGSLVGSDTTTVTATVINPTTGRDVAGQPLEATVFLAIQPVLLSGAVTNEFLTTDVGAFLAAQPDITLFETLGNSLFVLDPLQDLTNKLQVDAAVKGMPLPGEECRNWLNPAGPVGRLDLAQTILTSAESLDPIATTYEGTITFGVPCNTCSIDGSLCSAAPGQSCPAGAGVCGGAVVTTDRVRAVNLNVPDTLTFGGVFSPSERINFANAGGVVGSERSGLTNATTSRTFELLIVDTNLNTSPTAPPGDVETGQTDDFGLVIEVLDTEPGAPVVPGQFVFLSYTGGLQGADIDPLILAEGSVLLNLIYLDLDNLHDVLGIRSIERVIVIDSGNNTGEIEVLEAYSLNPVVGGGCLVDTQCDNGIFCDGPETCVAGTCQQGTPPTCNDGIACTTDACNPVTDVCDNLPNNAVCDNTLFCDGLESCNPAVGCVTGTPVDCDDGVVCTADSCNEATQACDHIPDGSLCLDGDPCTQGSCILNACQHDPIPNCACVVASPPAPLLIESSTGASVISTNNRFLSFSAGDPGRLQAVRVTLVSLPDAYSAWNGVSLWVGPVSDCSELGGDGCSDPIGQSPTFRVATLQCQPHFADFGAEGVIHVLHEGIVPSRLAVGGGAIAVPAMYDVHVVDEACDVMSEDSFSAPLNLTTAAWGDVGGRFQNGGFTAPDLNIEIPIDAIALLDKFTNRVGAPSKPRADLEPAVLDGRINISEVVLTINAFAGRSYPFTPSAADPCAP